MISSMIHLGVPVATETKTGGAVGNLDRLLGNLVMVTGHVCTGLLASHYNKKSLTCLNSGVDDQGRRLPSTPSAAADRLGWRPGWKVSDSRVLKLGQSNAMSVLKGQGWRMKLFDQLLPSLPAREDLRYSQRALQKITTGLAVKLGRYQDEVTIRAMVRSCMRYHDEHDRYPSDYFELFPTPPAAPQLANLGAVDHQFATRTTTGQGGGYVYHLHTKLPDTSGNLWVYNEYDIRFNIPECYHDRIKAALAAPGGGVTLPCVRLDRAGKIHITATLKEPAPAIEHPAGVQCVTGVDVNRDRSLVATVVQYDLASDTYAHDAHTHVWAGLGGVAKMLRLQCGNDELSRKIAALAALKKNNPSVTEQSKLEKKIQVLSTERTRINDKRKRINIELSHDAAGWIQAINESYGATAVFFEDLTSLPIAFDTHSNRVLSQLPRAKIVAYTHHLMARIGVLAATVPAGGTSSKCPYCLNELSHPDKYAVAVCPTCRFRAQRDDLAAVRIAQKGHAKHLKKKIIKRPEGPKASKGAGLDQKVIRAAKVGPTPRQVKDRYRKRRHQVKSKSYQKPVPFRHRRVMADMCVPESSVREHVQHQVGTSDCGGAASVCLG